MKKRKIDLNHGFGFVYCDNCEKVMPRDSELNCKVCGKPLPWRTGE